MPKTYITWKVKPDTVFAVVPQDYLDEYEQSHTIIDMVNEQSQAQDQSCLQTQDNKQELSLQANEVDLKVLDIFESLKSALITAQNDCERQKFQIENEITACQNEIIELDKEKFELESMANQAQENQLSKDNLAATVSFDNINSQDLSAQNIANKEDTLENLSMLASDNSTNEAKKTIDEQKDYISTDNINTLHNTNSFDAPKVHALGQEPYNGPRAQYGAMGQGPYNAPRAQYNAMGQGPYNGPRAQYGAMGQGPYNDPRAQYGAMGQANQGHSMPPFYNQNADHNWNNGAPVSHSALRSMPNNANNYMHMPNRQITSFDHMSSQSNVPWNANRGYIPMPVAPMPNPSVYYGNYVAPMGAHPFIVNGMPNAPIYRKQADIYIYIDFSISYINNLINMFLSRGLIVEQFNSFCAYQISDIILLPFFVDPLPSDHVFIYNEDKQSLWKWLKAEFGARNINLGKTN